MAEVVDHLPGLIPAVAVIGRDLRHGEIRLRQHNALRVDPNKNIRDLVNGQRLGKLGNTEVDPFDGHQTHQGLVDLRLLSGHAVGFAVPIDEFPSVKADIKNRRDVRNPLGILLDGRITNLKHFVNGIEGDGDTLLFIRGVHDFLSNNRCLNGCDTLLAVDQDLLSGRHLSVLETDVRILPDDDIPDWKPFIEGVHQVTDFGGVPYKGTLDLRDGDFSCLDRADDVFNRCAVYVKLCHVSSPSFTLRPAL